MKYKKKKKSNPTLVVLLLAVVIAAAGAAFYLVGKKLPSRAHETPEAYFGAGEDQVAVTAGSVLAPDKGRIIDGRIYLAYPTVAGQISKSFYYEEASRMLIVTTPKEKIMLDLADGGVTKGKEAEILNGVLYISLDYLKEKTDLEVRELDAPRRGVIDTVFTYPAADLSAPAPIRKEASIKADIIKDGSKGETLRTLDVGADGTALAGKAEGWTRVATEDGYVGYVEDQNLTGYRQETMEHQPLFEESPAPFGDGKINMVFHQTTSQAANAAFETAVQNVTGVNVIAPTWFFLKNKQGEMTSLASPAYVENAHQKGMKVWAVMNDFDGGVASADATAEALSTWQNRDKIVRAVMQGLDQSKADGLNIDFEQVTKASSPSFLELVRELAVECKKRGIALSVDNYVPTFTRYMDRREQARVADYVVTMCYDEHTDGAEKAGSVASLPFVRKGLEDTLQEVPASKLIAAIPFYTRLWTTDGSGAPGSTAYGMSDAAAAAKSLGMNLTFDENKGQNYGKAESNGTTYQMWMEDEASVKAKMEVISSLGAAGVAEWKLGQEDRGIWAVIDQYLA